LDQASSLEQLSTFAFDGEEVIVVNLEDYH